MLFWAVAVRWSPAQAAHPTPREGVDNKNSSLVALGEKLLVVYCLLTYCRPSLPKISKYIQEHVPYVQKSRFQKKSIRKSTFLTLNKASGFV